MSYLTLKKGIPNFSKAVISFWFRVPRKSVVAAADHKIETGVEGFSLLQSILPLVTFGAPQQGKIWATPEHDVAVNHSDGQSATYEAIYYQEEARYDVDPSYIGLRCDKSGTFRIEVNLQTDKFMAFEAATFITTQMDMWIGSDPAAPVAEADTLGTGVVGLFPFVGRAIIQDASYVDSERQPEWFTVQPNESLEPDQWHHLLLSFDVSGTVSIGTPFASSSCRLWYAIDSIDYRGAENMQPYRDLGGQWGRDTLDDNAILTRNAWRYSGSDPNWEAINYYQNHYVGLPSGSVNGSIPSGNAEMGIPSSIKFVDGIFRCEMAEFQMWTGVTLDTGIKNNRRAFVDDDGKPVDPTKGTEDDPRGPGERLLGRRPDILLHGNNNWQIGYNTGVLGVHIDNDGELQKIPSGQFAPTAKIEKFKPEPALSETPTA